MPIATKVLTLRSGDREILESWLRQRTLPRRLLERAHIVLASAEGLSRRTIAEEVGVAPATATLWIGRYEAEGLAGIERDRPRSGRPRKMTREIEEMVIEKTVTEAPPPEVATHWSTRLMAEATGLTREDIGRTWRKYGLKPHQIKRFKLSRDPKLVEKIHDVVGLYLDPPTQAVVFSFDEKSQMQALDRTQPGLPLKKGRAGTMTHAYKRYGTTTLFAALNVATGKVVHECMPRHRHQEFLKFLKKVESTVEPGLAIHVILDNYATHKHDRVRGWLRRNPRVHLHFIPTGSSWLNMVERLFSELTQKQLKRLAVTSVPELVSAVTHFLDHRNEAPRPYIWTKGAKEIIDKIDRGSKNFRVTPLGMTSRWLFPSPSDPTKPIGDEDARALLYAAEDLARQNATEMRGEEYADEVLEDLKDTAWYAYRRAWKTLRNALGWHENKNSNYCGGWSTKVGQISEVVYARLLPQVMLAVVEGMSVVEAVRRYGETDELKTSIDVAPERLPEVAG